MTTMTSEHSPFPSDETLAAFVDATLDERTRRQVIEHMAHCAECRDVVLDTSALKAESALPADSEIRLIPAPVVPIWRRTEARAALAAAAVVVVVLLAWPRDPIAKLARVAPPERYAEGRLSGLHYATMAPRHRGQKEEEIKAEELPLREALVGIERNAAEHPSARTLHAEGVALLMLGETADAEKAFGKALQYETHQSDISAAIQASKDPQLLSDLSAAYIEDFGRYAEALAAAERAWSLSDSKSPEAAWNRAMAAQKLDHRNQAVGYWHDYLKLDPHSQWASEARQKLKELETELQTR